MIPLKDLQPEKHSTVSLRKLRVLLLEDLSSDADLIRRELKTAAFACVIRVVDCKADYIRALNECVPDIILSDHTLPSFTSLEALGLAIERFGKIPFILVTGTMTEEFAVEVMKEGAWDYVPKNQLQRLPDAITKAMDKFGNESLRKKFVYDLILNEASMQEAERVVNYGSWELNVKTRKLKLSKQAYNVIGYTQGAPELGYKDILNKLSPEEEPHLRLIINQVLKNPDVDIYKENFRLVDRDGLYRSLKVGFVLKHDFQRKLLGVSGFVQHVPDVFALEEKLSQSEENFNCLTASIEGAAVFVLNASGYILNSNKEAQTIFGFCENEIKNKHISSFYANNENCNDELISHLEVKTDIPRLETKSRFATKNGSELWADVVITALSNKSGNSRGFIMVIRQGNAVPIV